MDYDSSTKFISSLAKFLQSLCNGYVEFDSGVQVIGHLYINVDTGKSIDYVLNEKVCKTEENSVTFISNSFHAQPAEKPKPPGKRLDRDSDNSSLKDENTENGKQTEPKSTNMGTMQGSRNVHSNSQAGAKRPYSPSTKGRSSPKNKMRRTNIEAHNPHSATGSMNSSPADMLDQHSVGQESQAFSETETYPPVFFNNDVDQEQRDVKPSFDTDVTFIKEEYGSSNMQPGNQDDSNAGAGDSSTYSSPYSNQPFNPGAYSQGGFPPSQRSTFNPAGDFGTGSSQFEGGDMANDPSDTTHTAFPKASLVKVKDQVKVDPRVDQTIDDERPYACITCHKTFTLACSLSRHKGQCNGTRVIICEECGKRFHRRDSLQQHLKHKHNIHLV